MERDLGKPPPGGGAVGGEGSWQQVRDILRAVAGADALLALTECEQFGQIDWPAVAAAARASRLQVWSVGNSG